jgi:hypothetical protein
VLVVDVDVDVDLDVVEVVSEANNKTDILALIKQNFPSYLLSKYSL